MILPLMNGATAVPDAQAKLEIYFNLHPSGWRDKFKAVPRSIDSGTEDLISATKYMRQCYLAEKKNRKRLNDGKSIGRGDDGGNSGGGSGGGGRNDSREGKNNNKSGGGGNGSYVYHFYGGLPPAAANSTDGKTASGLPMVPYHQYFMHPAMRAGMWGPPPVSGGGDSHHFDVIKQSDSADSRDENRSNNLPDIGNLSRGAPGARPGGVPPLFSRAPGYGPGHRRRG